LGRNGRLGGRVRVHTVLDGSTHTTGYGSSNKCIG
jgi:hypothetical protein